MADVSLSYMAGSIGASYAKRLLDQRFYDRLAQTARFKRLKALGRGEKHSIEGLLYVVNAVVDASFKDNTVIRRFLREIITDAPTEIGARLINGGGRNPYYGSSVIMELSNEELSLFLDWYDEADDDQRMVIQDVIKKHTARQIGRILRLSPQDRDRLVTLISPGTIPPKPRRIGWLDRITARMRGERSVAWAR